MIVAGECMPLDSSNLTGEGSAWVAVDPTPDGTYTLGSSYKSVCGEGYEVNGTVEITCEATGPTTVEWSSPPDATHCQSKNI